MEVPIDSQVMIPLTDFGADITGNWEKSLPIICVIAVVRVSLGGHRRRNVVSGIQGIHSQRAVCGRVRFEGISDGNRAVNVRVLEVGFSV